MPYHPKTTAMNIIPLLEKELTTEAETTRKMLQRVPAEKFDWRPHPKSMNLRELSMHLSEVTGWLELILTAGELDFATAPYQPTHIENETELLAFFEKNLATGTKALANAKENDLWETWTMRNGDDIYEKSTKYEAIRGTFGQVVHHRAQLGVFLRLLNVPIPGTYGPSADENNWSFE